jgi:putative peptidoglycan binding protein
MGTAGRANYRLKCRSAMKEEHCIGSPNASHMKTKRFSYWIIAVAAGLLPISAQARGTGHGFGGFGGRGFGHHFGSFHGDHHFFHDNFFRDHRRFFVGFDFIGFGFPYWWYPDYYYYGYYGYPYSDSDDSQVYDYRYWYGLATAVQTKLTELGYYRGPIDGVIGVQSQESIKAFQKAKGQAANGLINPDLLKALKLPAVPRTA